MRQKQELEDGDWADPTIQACTELGRHVSVQAESLHERHLVWSMYYYSLEYDTSAVKGAFSRLCLGDFHTARQRDGRRP